MKAKMLSLFVVSIALLVTFNPVKANDSSIASGSNSILNLQYVSSEGKNREDSPLYGRGHDFMPNFSIKDRDGSDNDGKEIALIGPHVNSGKGDDVEVNIDRRTSTLSFTDGRIPVGQVIANPEPATVLLLGTGLSGLAGAIWKRRKRSN